MNELYKIKNKFEENIHNLELYFTSIENMFFLLCESHAELVKRIPSLHSCKSHNDISRNCTNIKKEIDDCVSNCHQQLVKIEISEEKYNDAINYFELIGKSKELVFSIFGLMDKGITEQENIFNEIQATLEVMCIIKGELEGYEWLDTLYYNRNELIKLIDLCINYRRMNDRLKIKKDISDLVNIKNSIELFCPENITNVYRQCFIQTMAFFDCCIFELIESSMISNYFLWLKRFKNYTIKTHDMSCYDTFESFRNHHIKEILKNCYIKDVLEIIKEIDNNVFTDNEESVFSEILELIGRRNVHMHNNGIVDKAYMDRYNINNKSVGDFLVVDSETMQLANVLTEKIVRNSVIALERI